MSMLTGSSGVLARYDAMCRLVTARGNGITLREMGLAARLAEALEAPVDREHVARLTEELGLDPEALGGDR